MRHSDSTDILRKARGELQAPEGATSPGIGVTLSVGGTREQRTLVDEHERLHMELNSCNSFGLLLSLIGAGQGKLSPDERSELLSNLVQTCRTVHEVYATTISTWQVPRDRREGALSPYPGYVYFLRLGERFAQGHAPESMVSTALVVGACVASMQVPLELLLEEQGGQLSGGLQVAAAHRPNERFSELARGLDDEGFDFSWTTRDVDPRWLKERDPDPYGSPDYKQAYHEVLIRAYHQYGWWLSQRGYPVLPWDGHLKYRTLDSTVGAGSFDEQHLGGAEVETLAAETAARSDRHQAVRSGEQQSLRRPGGKGALRILSGTDPVLFAHTESAPGLHVIARPVESVIQSYGVADEHADVLRSVAYGGVLTAVRKMYYEEEGPLTVLGLLRSVDDFQTLIEGCIADSRIPPSFVSSTSVSCLFSQGWADEWITPLRHITHPVLLYDLPPTVFLDLEEKNELRFTSVMFEKERGEDQHLDPVRGVAVERTRAYMKMDRWTAFLGSEVLMSNFAARLSDLSGAVPGESILQSPLGRAMFHLAHEEPEFHFRGGEFIPPVQIREPVLDQATFDRWDALARRLVAHQASWQEE